MMRQTLLALALMGFTAGGVAAQGLPDVSQMAAQITKNRAENNQKMQDYTWKRRTEVVNDGEVKTTRLELVRFDVDGRMQTTLISEQAPEQRQMRGIRGRMQERMVKAQKEKMAELQGLLKKYALSTPREIRAFLDKATFGRGERPGTVRIIGANVVQPGDELVMIVDTQTKDLQMTKIRTRLEDEPVLMDINQDKLADGLSYQARTIIQMPSSKLRMTIENLDYQRQR